MAKPEDLLYEAYNEGIRDEVLAESRRLAELAGKYKHMHINTRLEEALNNIRDERKKRMRTYRGDTFADVYEKALRDTLENPDYTSKPRGMQIKEISNAALVIDDPYFPLYENEKRSSQFKYIAGETIWYFTGRKDIDFISRYSKFWSQLDNGDGTVNSAYGNLIFNEPLSDGRNQYQWALDSLIEDKDSRQAIIHFNKPSHQWKGNKDFVCTLNGVFQIRDNRLNFTVDMRSNDLILGTATDVAFFCLLQQQMLRHLQVNLS